MKQSFPELNFYFFHNIVDIYHHETRFHSLTLQWSSKCGVIQETLSFKIKKYNSLTSPEIIKILIRRLFQRVGLGSIN
jgi:hypothetical protein